MSDKLAIILTNSDRQVLEMGLVYALNVIAEQWMSEVQIYLFGPSEVTIATDPDLKELLCNVIEAGNTPVACKWCSDKYHVTALLEEMGCEIAYIGQPVTEAIRTGFTPMTW